MNLETLEILMPLIFLPTFLVIGGMWFFVWRKYKTPMGTVDICINIFECHWSSHEP